MRQDAIFYQIFKRFPSLFFELIGHPAQIHDYRFESVEIKEPSFRIDGVFLPSESVSPKIVFFAEVQFQRDQSLYHRFFSELFLYLYRNQIYDDWYGVLIFPNRGLEPDRSTIHRTLLDSPQVQCLYLDELEPNRQSVGVSLVQLMVENEDQTAERAKQLIAQVRQEDTGNLSEEEIIDIVTTIVVYKLINLSREEVEAMLGLTIEQTRVYQEAKEEGREEGRLEAKLEMVPVLLDMGLTIEQVAERLSLSVAVVQQADVQ